RDRSDKRFQRLREELRRNKVPFGSNPDPITEKCPVVNLDWITSLNSQILRNGTFWSTWEYAVWWTTMTELELLHNFFSWLGEQNASGFKAVGVIFWCQTARDQARFLLVADRFELVIALRMVLRNMIFIGFSPLCNELLVSSNSTVVGKANK